MARPSILAPVHRFFCSHNVATKKWTILLTPCAATLLTCTMLAGFGQYSQIFEILSHLVTLYFAFSLLLLVLSLALRSRLALFISLIALTISLVRMLPAFERASTFDGQRVSILAFNCERDLNSDPKILRRIVEERRPDIICLSEVDETWKKLFEKDCADYPYKQVCANNWGVACLSKLPIAFSQTRFSQYNHHPRMFCTFRLHDGRTLTGLIVHPSIPLNARSYKSRNSDFEIFANDLAEIKGCKFIVGDLNCSPWSFYYQKLLSDTALKDAMNGFGVVCTWSPKWMHFPLVPIDHCLVSDDLSVHDYKMERDAGSDHRPIFIELSVLDK